MVECGEIAGAEGVAGVVGMLLNSHSRTSSRGFWEVAVPVAGLLALFPLFPPMLNLANCSRGSLLLAA